jgi:hypothetical protein
VTGDHPAPPHRAAKFPAEVKVTMPSGATIRQDLTADEANEVVALLTRFVQEETADA